MTIILRYLVEIFIQYENENNMVLALTTVGLLRLSTSHNGRLGILLPCKGANFFGIPFLKLFFIFLKRLLIFFLV